MRTTILLLCAATLSACGLGDTATSAAVAAKTKAREIEQARVNRPGFRGGHLN